jgi:LPS-assembly protein
VPEVGIAGFTEFARIFDLGAKPLTETKANVGQSRWLALRHSIQPRLEFRHRANIDQERNPYYSTEDRLAPRTELVYSITNVLTGKRDHVVMVKDPVSEEMVPALSTSYRDVLSLRLEQAYDHREASRNHERDTYPRRPFGDVFSDLTAHLTDHVWVSTRNTWSPYKNELTRHQSGVGLNVPKYGQLYVGYDMRTAIREYTRRNDSRVSFLRVDATTVSFGPWSLRASYRQDYRNHRNRETDVNLIYTHQCFQFIGRVSHQPQESSYHLYIVLFGLGN